MRKLFIILTLAIAMISSAIAAEAAPRNKCVCTALSGTIGRSCPKHRNCYGIPQHQHESKNRLRNIPVLCEVKDFYLLIDPSGPPTKIVKKQLKAEARAQKKHERELAHAYKEQARQERINRKNNPLFWIVDVTEKEVKRQVRGNIRDKKNDIRRNIKREIRDIF